MDANATILVVDDDEEVLDVMRDYLTAEGYHVETAQDGPTALSVIEETPVDGVILDVMLPGQTGFDICRQIRMRLDLPILFLSAFQDEVHKLRGLGLGADDYIVKTCSPAEVAARVKAVLRRSRKGTPKQGIQMRFGQLVIDLTAYEVRVDGATVPFTSKEFELLRHLAEHPRQVFTRSHLTSLLWDGIGDPQAVNGLINRIRAKIEPSPDRPTYITTVWGVGYRFEGEQSQ